MKKIVFDDAKCDLYSQMKSLIAENMPFFESEDKDEYLYILKDDDISRLAHVITSYIEDGLKGTLYFPREKDVILPKLKPCPFCGESELIKPTLLPTTEGEPWKAIRCMACGAHGPISRDGLEANRLWDEREGNHEN